MITALAVAEARIKAVLLGDELRTVRALAMDREWLRATSNIPGELLVARAELTAEYAEAFAVWREADIAVARLEAQRTDEQAAVDRQIVQDTAMLFCPRRS